MSNLITPKGGWTGSEIQGRPNNGEMVCPNCRAEYRPGFTTCSDCAVALVSEVLPPSSTAEDPLTNSLTSLKCTQHPEIHAVARCRGCSSGVCATCDFQISGGLHFCPKCIDSAGDQKIDPRRKKLAVCALVAAVYCTLVGIFTFSGAVYRAMGGAGNEQAIGVFVMYGLYVPSLIGTVLGLSAFERRLKNTQLVWTALIWSIALTAIFIIMEAAARMR